MSSIRGRSIGQSLRYDSNVSHVEQSIASLFIMGRKIENDKTKLSRSGTGKSFFRKFIPDSVHFSRSCAPARRAREKRGVVAGLLTEPQVVTEGLRNARQTRRRD